MSEYSRRDFLKTAGVAAAAGCLGLPNASAKGAQPSAGPSAIPFALGLASYSVRAFSLDQAIEMTRRLGLSRITLKDFHLPLDSSTQSIKSALAKIRGAGLELSSCGVVYMTTDAEVNRAFDYAKAAELTMLVGVPTPALLSLAEQKVKQTGIALAIHNHGPTDNRYPSPESAYRLIASMDSRMGLCLDAGHTRRLGLDPAVEAERFFDRLLDVHIKDVTTADANGTTVEMGRGVVDIPGLIRMLLQKKYARTLHFEFEKDEHDPLPGLAESVGYLHGVLAAM